ncbi:TadE/TadG family type IV pilus assembly protein [Gemmobacter denitrificans]|uniref:TadE/TadG family type IV pilus assembly protein n=1 Tax=Gemmobacter denitrificans TaxID=3123040 RepID=A0ABU8BXR4_9RHOB
MIRRLRNPLRPLRRFWRREDGTSTVEFALMVPVFLTVFMMSFETGLLMLRQTMLERALDITMREVRLGRLNLSGDAESIHDAMKDLICQNGVMLDNCNDTLRLAMTPVDMTTWDLPTSGIICQDRDEPSAPVTEVSTDPQARRNMMLVRACMRAESMFPGTALAAGLRYDDYDDYALVSVSFFVNEP